MEPPRLGSIPLVDDVAAPCAGAAFELVNPAAESEGVSIDAWHVEVAAAHKVVVARGGTAEDAQTAFRTGLLNAQKGLDLMSLRGSNNLVINRFDDNHTLWWPRNDELTVRIVSFATLKFDVPPATVVVRDANGNIVPQTDPPPVTWHESFRYFRLSQTTDDLFDAYRNVYLALESVLSSIAPQKSNVTGKVSESEGQWFKRALAAAGNLVDLLPFTPAGTLDPVQHLWDELYREMRSAMSHAKCGRKVLLPQDDSERQAVSASLQRLVRLYLALAEAHLNVRRASGGLFAVAFRMMASPALDSASVYASDDESPPNPSDTVPNPDGGLLEELTPDSGVLQLSSFLIAKIWSSPVAEISNLPFVRRIVAAHGSDPFSAGILEARLFLGSAGRLEAMLGIRGTNSRLPRERYSY
ncbi:MAG TPA: hypothetical protein VKA25_06865 [Gemmatimonadales bacterium]|nr:hypothetical protein [Gemmatimonadales bacterium]